MFCVHRYTKFPIALRFMTMITVLKIAVLCLCTAILFVIACYNEHKKGTCILLSFFVAAGSTTFFSKESLLLSMLFAFGVFLVLSLMTVLLSHKTMHRKHREEKHKSF